MSGQNLRLQMDGVWKRLRAAGLSGTTQAADEASMVYAVDLHYSKVESICSACIDQAKVFMRMSIARQCCS